LNIKKDNSQNRERKRNIDSWKSQNNPFCSTKEDTELSHQINRTLRRTQGCLSNCGERNGGWRGEERRKIKTECITRLGDKVYIIIGKAGDNGEPSRM
jgi:hypothetical protein